MDQAANLRKLVQEKKKSKGIVHEVLRENNPQQPRIIAVASGKGGVGKTNFAINLGIMLAKKDKKVIVMDADLGLANVNVILGVIPQFNLYHVMKGQKTIEDIIIDTAQGIRIIAGASGFSQLANLNEEERMNFVNGLGEKFEADYIIIDTGAGVSRNVLSFVLAADEAIIVTTPEPTAITDAYGIIKAITAETDQCGVKLVVNRIQSFGEGRQVADRVINIASQFLNVKVENLGYVFEDEAVMQSVRKQKPFVEAYPKSRVAFSVEHIACSLLHLPVPDRKGGFGRFIKSFLSFYKED